MIEVEYDREHDTTTKKRSRDFREEKEEEEENFSENTCACATIACSGSSSSSSNGVDQTLRNWWNSLEGVTTPVQHVAFVVSEVSAVLINNPGLSVQPADDLDQKYDFDAQPLLVFYILRPRSLVVLGGMLIHEFRAHEQKQRGGGGRALKMRHLCRDVCTLAKLDALPHVRGQGIQEEEERDGKSWWFRMPRDLMYDIFDRIPGGDPSEYALYRMALMISFWEHRDNPMFENDDGDGDKILQQLHDVFFDMWTDEGRDADVAGFWGLFLMCGQDDRLWPIWKHWEQRLLSFRIRQCLSTEKHFLQFLVHNKKLFRRRRRRSQHESDEDDDDDKQEQRRRQHESDEDKQEQRRSQHESDDDKQEQRRRQHESDEDKQEQRAVQQGLFVPYTQEQMDDRELALYRARYPRGPMPKFWFRVRCSDSGPHIMRNELFDVEQDCVFVTYREFFAWAWHQMDVMTRDHLKWIRLSRGIPNARSILTECPVHIRLMANDGVEEAWTRLSLPPALSWQQEEQGDKGKNTRYMRAAAAAASGFKGNGGAGVLTLEGVDGLTLTTSEFVDLCKARLPPCMSQHVWEALENGHHPENMSRLSFSMFLLSAGYTVEQVDSIMMMLYAADTTMIQTRYNGVWDDVGYKRENGGNVKALKRSLFEVGKTSPYGCLKLVGDGEHGKFHGCPFAKKNTITMAAAAQTRPPQIVSLLQWSGCSDADIEDIMRPANFPQEKCQRYLVKRNPRASAVIVKHPNHFFRCSDLNTPPVITTTTTTK